MTDSNATSAAAAEELAQFQHESDQLMFWTNYKVRTQTERNQSINQPPKSNSKQNIKHLTISRR